MLSFSNALLFIIFFIIFIAVRAKGRSRFTNLLIRFWIAFCQMTNIWLIIMAKKNSYSWGLTKELQNLWIGQFTTSSFHRHFHMPKIMASYPSKIVTKSHLFVTPSFPVLLSISGSELLRLEIIIKTMISLFEPSIPSLGVVLFYLLVKTIIKITYLIVMTWLFFIFNVCYYFYSFWK